MLDTLDGRVLGTTTRGDQNLLRGELLDLLFLVDSLDSMSIDDGGIGVQVLDVLVAQLNAIAPVERANVVLDGLDQLGPVVLFLLRAELPTVVLSVLYKKNGQRK